MMSENGSTIDAVVPGNDRHDEEARSVTRPSSAAVRFIRECMSPKWTIDALVDCGALEQPADDLRPRIGPYEVLDIVGEGGMGVVLRCKGHASPEDVAIKVLRPELRDDPRAVVDFIREAAVMSSLRHDRILRVEKPVERAEGPYYVMPYLKAGSLARLLRPDQPLEDETILRISLQIAEALNYIHGKTSFVHRDIKPDNILLGEGGRVYLADLGLARTLAHNSLSQVDAPQLVGTAPYMSPQTAAGQNDHVFADIYSFGAVMYEMLTGRPPYQGCDVGEILCKVLQGPPEPIENINSNADPRLVKVCNGAMGREPRARYARMYYVMEDLQRIDQAVELSGPGAGAVARPPGLEEPPSKWVWALVLLATVVLLVVPASWLMRGFVDFAHDPRQGVAQKASDALETSPGPPRHIVRIETMNLELFRTVRGQSTSMAVLQLQEAGTKTPFFPQIEDDIRVRSHLNRPATVALFDLNPKGRVGTCNLGPKVRSGLETEIVYPLGENGYGLETVDGEGLQAFILVAGRGHDFSPESIRNECARLWKAIPVTPQANPWHYDGKEFAPIALTRGRERLLAGAPEPFLEVCRRVESLRGVEAIRAVVFPVRGPVDDQEPVTDRTR